MPNTKPTIDDVAALAGVGRTTVSRVLNQKPNVRGEVRERVMAAVAQLDFRVNQQARSLAGKSAKRVVLIHATDFDTEPNSYYHSAIELGATRAAARLGVQLTTHIVNQNDPDVGLTIRTVVRDSRADGLILTPPFADQIELVESIQALDCRVVCISGGDRVAVITATLGIDEWQASFDLTRHLLDCGHRRFGFVHGIAAYESAAQRFAGFLGALEKVGLGRDAVSEAQGNFTFRSGIDCMQQLLSGVQRPTAVVCANDDMAAGALLAAHKAGLQIPQDVAITGFDDTPVSEIVWPPLTTVHQPLRRMGERAVERAAADEGTDGEPTAGAELIAHRLVLRDSTNFQS